MRCASNLAAARPDWLLGTKSWQIAHRRSAGEPPAAPRCYLGRSAERCWGRCSALAMSQLGTVPFTPAPARCSTSAPTRSRHWRRIRCETKLSHVETSRQTKLAVNQSRMCVLCTTSRLGVRTGARRLGHTTVSSRPVHRLWSIHDDPPPRPPAPR